MRAKQDAAKFLRDVAANPHTFAGVPWCDMGPNEAVKIADEIDCLRAENDQLAHDLYEKSVAYQTASDDRDAKPATAPEAAKVECKCGTCLGYGTLRGSYRPCPACGGSGVKP